MTINQRIEHTRTLAASLYWAGILSYRRCNIASYIEKDHIHDSIRRVGVGMGRNTVQIAKIASA